MRSRYVVITLLAASCGGSPAPAKPSAPAAPTQVVVPEKPVCIAADDAPAISHAGGDEKHAQYCIGPTTEHCFTLDLETGGLTRSAPVVDAPPPARIEATATSVSVCSADACKLIPLKPTPAGGTGLLHATTNADGTVAVVLLGDAENGRGGAEVWDVTAGKRTAVIKYAAGDYKCGDARVLGGSIFINASTCAGPAARGTLYSSKGKKIAAVGGRDFGSFGAAAVEIGHTSWAFLAENGNQIVIQDVGTGKLSKPIDVSALWRKDGEAAGSDAIGNPGESALVKLADGKLAVIAGSPANGSVAVVDVAAATVKVMRAPLCAP